MCLVVWESEITRFLPYLDGIQVTSPRLIRHPCGAAEASRSPTVVCCVWCGPNDLDSEGAKGATTPKPCSKRIQSNASIPRGGR